MGVSRRLVLRFALYGAAAAVVSSCNYRSEEFRYRMTVEVETPQGVRTGSSVIEVRVSEPGSNSLPEAGVTTKIRGEAVAIDLPGGKTLFALLRTPDDADAAASFPYQALKPPRYRGEYGAIKQTRELKRMQGLGQLPEQYYPMLVAFDNINDPQSVKQVDPNNLADDFGPNVTLKRVTIRMVDDDVTFNLADRIAWLDKYVDKHFDGSATISEGFTPNYLPSRLYSGSFSTEFAR